MVGCTERTITFPHTIGATNNSKEENANTVLMQHCLDAGQQRMVAELNSESSAVGSCLDPIVK